MKKKPKHSMEKAFWDQRNNLRDFIFKHII